MIRSLVARLEAGQAVARRRNLSRAGLEEAWGASQMVIWVAVGDPEEEE